MSKKNQKNEKKMTQFEAIECVVRNAEESELSAQFFKHVDSSLKTIADKQRLTTNQALMLCLIMNYCDNSNIRLGDLANLTGVSTVYLLKYLGDIDELVARRFIRRVHLQNGESYSIRYEVITALKQDKAFEVEKHCGISCEKLFDIIGNIVNEHDEYENKRGLVMNLLHDNPHLKVTQVIKGYQLSDDDTMLLMLFCHLLINNENDIVQMDDIENFGDEDQFRSWRHLLSREEHPLQHKKLIEFGPVGSMIDIRYYHLTDKAKCDLLGEWDVCFKKKARPQSLPKDFVSHKRVATKQMFYTLDNQAQVDRLAQLLDEKKFREVCRRMKQRGMRTGFACLFYGAPGTGKTETVMQLARQMKRDVMVVDFAQIRSKWVGDSEKNIKGVFERYRHFCKQLRRKPILLFNEADAVINTRSQLATHSVDKMENTMQNIILQEMEQFDGIMIATTNLAQNMDPAFERRFLYKIQFERPDASVRAHLWQEMIPELDTEECQALGEQFDFSGGQIENVARKYAINTILNDIKPSDRLNELIALCREECLNDTKSTRAHVGFVA